MSHVLVIDDDADVRDALQAALGAAGFAVRTANAGADALESLKRSPAALVLLDLMMPTMSGVEILQQMRSDDRLKTIPVVITSAWPERARRLSGAQGILRKPIDFDALVEIAQRFCGRG
jgi:CheY-like chemotaxis protein